MIVPPMAGLAVIYGRYLRSISKRTQDSLAEATQVNKSCFGCWKTARGCFFWQKRLAQKWTGPCWKTSLSSSELKWRCNLLPPVSLTPPLLFVAFSQHAYSLFSLSAQSPLLLPPALSLSFSLSLSPSHLCLSWPRRGSVTWERCERLGRSGARWRSTWKGSTTSSSWPRRRLCWGPASLGWWVA